jgi:hypothetical protein
MLYHRLHLPFTPARRARSRVLRGVRFARPGRVARLRALQIQRHLHRTPAPLRFGGYTCPGGRCQGSACVAVQVCVRGALQRRSNPRNARAHTCPTKLVRRAIGSNGMLCVRGAHARSDKQHRAVSRALYHPFVRTRSRSSAIFRGVLVFCCRVAGVASASGQRRTLTMSRLIRRGIWLTTVRGARDKSTALPDPRLHNIATIWETKPRSASDNSRSIRETRALSAVESPAGDRTVRCS